MTDLSVPVADDALDERARTLDFLDRVRSLIPVIREHARASEQQRCVAQPIMDAAESAGLFTALVPRRWGGQGLGLDALTEAARLLAQGDTSVAWALSFLIEHNWMACRFPVRAQEELYADRTFILAAAPLVPNGTVARTDDGYVISGTWRYATGVSNSDWVFVTVPEEVDGEIVPRAFLMPKSDVVLADDWWVSGMQATSSQTVSGTDIFVPAHRSIVVEQFSSPERHGGVEHPEAIYHYPLHFGLNNMMAAIFVGTAEGVLGIFEDKLDTSRPFGLARRERATARVRWGRNRERIRAAHLLYADTLARTIAKCDERNGHTPEDLGNVQLATLSVAHLAYDSVVNLCEGVGSSSFRLDDPVQRYKRDIDVLINHAGMDWDVVADRSTRWILGFAPEESDWHSRVRKE